ncbi:hypothetical protein K505DRAFT_6951, partial [Melanomma pulvis-pyrius CBS 109.77]
MAALYDPDEAALLVQPWDEAFRTQRDLGLRVPINFLTVATASLRAACFGNNQYEDAAFGKCFSNLLASPFRSFIVDVYWDASRSVWSLCPVEVPLSAAAVPEAVSSNSSSSLSTSLGAASMGRRGMWESNGVLPTSLPGGIALEVQPRQDGSVSGSASTSVSSSTLSIGSSSISITAASSSTSVVSPPTAQFDNQNNSSALIEIGNYNCTSTMTLDFLASIFNSFLEVTDTTTEATITYLTLNIHAAASYSAPDAPAQQPGPNQTPGPLNLISNIMKGNLSDNMYTPNKLRDDRGDLGGSWHDVAWDILPASGYYQTSTDSENNLITQDGWPTEAYMEFIKKFRLIASFGSIDPQMANYNTTTDLDTIFAPGTIQNFHSSTFSSSGDITSGCLFSPSTPSLTATTNSSWALSIPPALNLGLNPNTTTPIPSVTNLTSCGVSSFLNTTLSNTTADQHPLPYVAFAHSTFWTWAPGSPANTSDSKPGATAERCAAMHTSPSPGRWRTIDCTLRRLAACQSPTNPYHWELSSTPGTYYRTSCPRNTTFSVPHTALENSHLLSALRSHP